VIPPLEQSLLDLGLVKSECFPVRGTDIYVLSPTEKGWKVAAERRFSDVLEKYSDIVGGKSIWKRLAEGLSLDKLPELLSSEIGLAREVASEQLEQLMGCQDNDGDD